MKHWIEDISEEFPHLVNRIINHCQSQKYDTFTNNRLGNKVKIDKENNAEIVE